MKLKRNTIYLLLLFFAGFLAYFIGRDFQFDPKFNWVHTLMKYLSYALLFLSVFASVSNTRELLSATEIKPKIVWMILSSVPVLFCLAVFVLSLTTHKLKLF